MYLEHIAAGKVKPCQHDELVPGRDAHQSLGCLRREIQPGVRGAFITLHGRRLELGQFRADKPNRF
jgi:hypothetical protein